MTRFKIILSNTHANRYVGAQYNIGERIDLGNSTDPAIVAKLNELRSRLQTYISSATAPLNETPQERKTDPASSPKHFTPQAWTPWQNSTK
jgi:hypothetical protein